MLTKRRFAYIVNNVNYMQGEGFMDWTDMVHYQQQMQKIMRALLPEHKPVLTVSECELLAHLYLKPDQNTPVLLSQGTGMKKEAVSRCLKTLYEKGCIRKEKQAADERSYRLYMKDAGLAGLKQGYESILQPFYDLWRSSGEDFEKFLYYADKVAAHIEKGQGSAREDEVL